ncbi:MAG: flagellar biosynthesis protein FlhB [Succinivibrionaceae bacterium]|nr:flagellar biosynthesis protein FlhB [Succinivibrionaceae bacterium]
MAESDGQEKTEQPTGKRLEDSRKKGQVARSKELGTLTVLLSGVCGLWAVSGWLYEALVTVVHKSFIISRADILDPGAMERLLKDDFLAVALPLVSMFAIVMVFALIGNIGVGGFNFSQEAMMPKFNKLNPLSGIKRVFSINSVVELVKGILKIILIGSFCYFLISGRIEEILALTTMEVTYAVKEAVHLMFWTILFIVCAMVPIAALDAPYQLWHYKEQLRMTKQEVKEEFKNQEGNPQVKAQMRQMMYQIINKKMMQQVPEADVVITNPEHYAVALKYDTDGSTAPILVAKGINDIAAKIREIATLHKVPIIPAPPLARALYYTTEYEEEIPRGLFGAVAQVLAYVFQMKEFRQGKGPRPRDLKKDLPIPPDMQYNPDGTRVEVESQTDEQEQK